MRGKIAHRSSRKEGVKVAFRMEEMNRLASEFYSDLRNHVDFDYRAGHGDKVDFIANILALNMRTFADQKKRHKA